jgi:hypothetical protein
MYNEIFFSEIGPRSRCLSLSLALLLWPASAQLGRAQGTVVFHNTGGGEPLVSEVRSIFLDAALQQPRLIFNFGFATDETPSPGGFLDSFTVTIQSTNLSFSAVYLTADATGIAWGPPTPGSLFIDPASINASALSYPSLQPVLATQTAFAVSAPLPAQFLGGSVNVFFDLFDNLDNKASQGWFSGVGVATVPEPRAWTLWLLGGALCWRFKRRTR